MPGPKMGPRPPDFDEEIIKQSPTYVKWTQMQTGGKLRYACREFIKGNGDDEERLMRRIMIARRNNIRDHETLKRARKMVTSVVAPPPPEPLSDQIAYPVNGLPITPPTQQQQQLQKQHHSDQHVNALPVHPQATVPPGSTLGGSSPSSSYGGMDYDSSMPDQDLSEEDEVRGEMDVSAVESTRSYRSWNDLPIGAEFVYNQRYVKGTEGHDWLLRKNIWRRMRYRRENKRLVARLRWQQQQHPVHEPFVRPTTLPRHGAACGRRAPSAGLEQTNNGTARSTQTPHQHQLRAQNSSSSLPESRKRSAAAALESPGKGHSGSDGTLSFRAPSPQHSATTADPLGRSDSEENHDHSTAALQASVAAAVAILEAGGEQHVIMDPDAVEAAVAAAESFRSSSDDHHGSESRVSLPVHDPILAAAAVVPASSNDGSQPEEQVQPDPSSVLSHYHVEGEELLVHDPLQAAALAARLAAVTGASADVDTAQTIDL